MADEKGALTVALVVIGVAFTSALGTALLARHVFSQVLAQQAHAQAKDNQSEIS